MAESFWRVRAHWGKWISCAQGPDGPCARGALRADELLLIHGNPQVFGQFRRKERWGSRKIGRSTCQTPNSWTKKTKSHKIQQIARKFFGAIFCGDFRICTENNKIKLASGGMGLQDVNKPFSWYQDVVGQNPRGYLVTLGGGKEEEHLRTQDTKHSNKTKYHIH